MSKEKGHIVSEEMLYRYWANDLSKTDRDVVSQWALTSPSNQRQLDEAEVFYLDMKALATLDDKNTAQTDKAWEKFKSQNLLSKQPPHKKHQLLPPQYLKYAAGLLLLLMAGWWYISSDNKQLEIATLEDTQELQLADGSNITLNQHSKLSYPETFGDSERKVSLKGEAYFQVAANEAQPFVITLNQAQVTVIGTAFNIDATSADHISVSVDEGTVRFSTISEEVLLHAGESASLDLYAKSLTKLAVPETPTHNFWRTKSLSFQNTPLDQVATALHDSYGSNIQLSNPALATCSITVHFENEELDNILDIISSTLDLKVTKTEQSYYLSGDGCH
ncbi:FecR family protein [Reichenbachiella agariperforans]|uniref:FecR family protein n=1 Tax=Reichenbachiella agariperforans TaxID=156994 RepID=UPI001C09AE63|nr:FecR domain-containing protein [Reichenbachiella agariperforans]MBU2913498.1 FecR domain-containing protein [Reichenbachiella agariperforans]